MNTDRRKRARKGDTEMNRQTTECRQETEGQQEKEPYTDRHMNIETETDRQIECERQNTDRWTDKQTDKGGTY